MNKVKPDTIARTACLVLALINQILAIFGRQALPWGEDMVYQFVSLGVTIVTAGIAWWKNNSFTAEAIQADIHLEELKSGRNR